MNTSEILKDWIKSATRWFGYDIVRYADIPAKPFDVLKYVVRETLSRESDFYFVQIGANDGTMADPLSDLIVRHGLKGLLVEPLPDFFQKLCAKYAGCEGLSFERCAIGERDGEAVLYRVRPDAPVPAWVHGLASFQRSNLSGRKFGVGSLDQYVEEVTVPCLTLASLLKGHGIRKVTLLQIDTEGFDCQIVRMAIEAGLRPSVINFEFNHTCPAERAACKRMLIEAGYSFVDVGRDTLAVRETADVPE